MLHARQDAPFPASWHGDHCFSVHREYTKRRGRAVHHAGTSKKAPSPKPPLPLPKHPSPPPPPSFVSATQSVQQLVVWDSMEGYSACGRMRGGHACMHRSRPVHGMARGAAAIGACTVNPPWVKTHHGMWQWQWSGMNGGAVRCGSCTVVCCMPCVLHQASMCPPRNASLEPVTSPPYLVWVRTPPSSWPSLPCS